MPKSERKTPAESESSDSSRYRTKKKKEKKHRSSTEKEKAFKVRKNKVSSNRLVDSGSLIFGSERDFVTCESETHMGYTNTDNPFGDNHLTETFVWSKKFAKDNMAGLSKKKIAALTKEKILQNKTELDKTRQSREERERQRAQILEEREFMQRQREAEQFKEWHSKEDRFHLEQARERSKIRINENRAKAVDFLARYIEQATTSSSKDDDLDIEMREPHTYLHGLLRRDLEDLIEDVKVYQKLDENVNDDYWKDVTTVAVDELKRLRERDPDDPEYVGTRRDGISRDVSKDVARIIKDKSHAELALLEVQILSKIKSNQEGVDVNYWEAVLNMLKVHMAKARLKHLHQEMLRKRLYRMKQEQEVRTAQPLFPSGRTSPGPVIPKPEVDADESMDEDQPPEKSTSNDDKDVFAGKPSSSDIIVWEGLGEEQVLNLCCQEYENGRYSPALIQESSLPPGTEIIDPVENVRRIEFAQKKFESSGCATDQQDAVLEAEARKGMNDNEATFAVEAPLEQKTYLWSDKYRPRKPRYFNRVHTGFEWNKYNQTHYDLDNPPPKIVQGYKFNIFYPDLLDPSVAPEFDLNPCDDNPDFAILHFRAGPPYEDIAFKVVNREWETCTKRGYRCSFQNGIFQLWFHFRKWRYRR